MAEREAFVCGSNVTLVCKIKKSTNMSAWMYENDPISIAECNRNNRNPCSVNPAYADKYEFTYDIDQGVYNLTIIKLNINDTNRKLVCSNGDESVSEKIVLTGKMTLNFRYI